MHLRKLGDGFLIGGVVVGALAAVGFAADIVPDLPPAVLKLVIYKLTFIGGLGMVVFGAFLRRIASRPARGDEAASTAQPDSISGEAPRPALKEPMRLDERPPVQAREPAPVRDRRPR